MCQDQGRTEDVRGARSKVYTGNSDGLSGVRFSQFVNDLSMMWLSDLNSSQIFIGSPNSPMTTVLQPVLTDF